MCDLLVALDKLREAVLAGQFDGLPTLTANIESLLAQADGLSAPESAAVAESARRNNAILGAALQGMRAARRRLADLREASTGHRTYGRQGQRSSVGAAPMTLQQRV